MTDHEITRLCAEAMGLDFDYDDTDVWIGTDADSTQYAYHPLSDDAQAMALVKKFGLEIEHFLRPPHWTVTPASLAVDGVVDSSLNRAICLCAAKMQMRQSEGKSGA